MAVKTYKKGDTAKLSKNFSVLEFSCHGHGCCSTVMIDADLVDYLQRIRDHFGGPVNITSGYRCPAHNKSVGGTTASRHAKGQAADIVVEGVAPAEVAKYAESIGVKGVGLYETDKDGHFTHIDTRGTKSFWYGQAQGYRSTFGGSAAPTAPASAAKGYTLAQFIKDVQKACGAAVDGVAGQETLSRTVTVSASKNQRHAVVEVLQRRLLTLGYTQAGTADGVAGPKFTAAVKAYQRDNDCVQDGEITEHGRTWRKLLGMA